MNSHRCYKFLLISFVLTVVCLFISSCSKANALTADEINSLLSESDFCDDMVFHATTQRCYSASFSNYTMLEGWALGGKPWDELCNVYKELSLDLYERSGKQIDVIFLLVNPYKTYQVLFATQNGDDITDNYSIYWREAAMLSHDVGELVSYESVIAGFHASEVISLKAKINSIKIEASDWSHIDIAFWSEDGNYSSYNESFTFFCVPENEEAYKQMMSFDSGDEIIIYFSIYPDSSFGASSILWVDPA